MSTWQAVLLGIVQGLTEFLPISSSGHLVLFQNLLGFREPELLLDICLHLGTLAAVLIVFQRDIRDILATLIRLPVLAGPAGGFKALLRQDPHVRICFLIGVGSLPTAVLGLLFHRLADRIFANVTLVGAMLLVTGSLLWFTRRARPAARPLQHMRSRDAAWIGLAQGLAILPGISRSGATISTALYLGIDRRLAGRFSFLLSIPAIVGALLLEIKSADLHASATATAIVLGTVAAGISGYFALVVLLRLVEKGKIQYFAPYCWLLGCAALIWQAVS
ncbi:MAG TPA: undecaprenyl-diphosphate phosphatase [Desulfobacterales bacterium]